MVVSVSSLKADPRVQFVSELDASRVVVKIPTKLVKVHPLLAKIRGKQPDIERLSASIKKTGGAFYTILMYAEFNAQAGHIDYFVADGHQRLTAALAAKTLDIYATIILRWVSAEEAFKEATSVQYARFDMQVIDLFSVIRQRLLTDQELADMTGESTTTIGRMRKVCDHQAMVSLIDLDVMSTNVGATLVDKCDKNPLKLQLLTDKLCSEKAKAEKAAKHYANKYKVNGMPKEKKLQDLAKVSHHFPRDWSAWQAAIDTVESDSTQLVIEVDSSAKATIEFSDAAKAWEDDVPVYFKGGNKHRDMSLENLKSFREFLPTLQQNLDTLIERYAMADAKAKTPFKAVNPEVTIDAPPEPADQPTDDMEIEEPDDQS